MIPLFISEKRIKMHSVVSENNSNKYKLNFIFYSVI